MTRWRAVGGRSARLAWLARAAALAGLTGLMLAWAETAAAETPVDLELVLAVDVSGSMDTDEQHVQRAGYVAAITHPDVLGAIRSGPYGRIALIYVEWAGPSAQAVTIPWSLIEDAASAERFASALAEAPTARIRGTSISGSLMFSARLFHNNGYEGFRQVIDISGDGPNNTGFPVVPARDAVLEQGIIINGLPLLIRPSGGYGSISNLDIYYEDCVIGGPGSFMIPVRSPDQFAEAIRQKLVLEIAGNFPPLVLVQQGGRTPRIDCMIGERQRRTWEFER